ncbi:MAG: hypothetical protein ACLFOY_10515 [Desulfatibacillaceae bacterium]
MPTDQALHTLDALRNPELFRWYVIPLFALVTYVYANEIEKRNWSMVFAGLAFWGMDWFNEIWNGLVFHFTGHAPVWGINMDTAYVIFMGLNIEICFMFAIAGIAFAKMLPRDKHMRIAGVNNRLFMAITGSIFCVFVEILLNQAGALVWQWGFWNARVPWLIFLVGYMPFFLVSFRVFDMESTKGQATVVGGIFAFDAALILVFGVALGWI